MTLQIGIGVGALVLVVFWLMQKGPSLLKIVEQAVASQDTTALLEAASALPTKQQSYFYQQSIQLLWNGYHRELAGQVIKAFAAAHPDVKICQYWLRQLLELEPEIAEEVLGESFVESHYLPEVAACCGVASS